MSFGNVFRIAIELPEICCKKDALYTKSAFCKEYKKWLFTSGKT
tara:strand:+ start:6359 stop:6490 length:132 start_codon:yes stop_codon:yes gene_type:complete